MIWIGVVAPSIASAAGLTASLEADSGLVSLWRGEGNTLDSVGNNKGVSSTAGYQPGKWGQALSFDGAGTRIELGDPESLRFINNFSFEYWAYVNAELPNGGAVVLVFRGDARSGLDPYVMSMLFPRTLVFKIEDAKGASALVSTEIPVKTWLHIAATFSDGTLRLFVNGELAGKTVGTVFPFADLQAGGGCALGNTTASHNFAFGGLMDEVAAYSRVLGADEIRKLYRLGGLKHCPDNNEFSKLSQEDRTRVIDAGCPLSYLQQATGTAQVVNGFVVGVTLKDPGYGYTNAPIVKIIGGGGSGAIATAEVSNGFVVGIHIESPGKGYTSTPIVLIASPGKLPGLTIRTTRVALDLSLVLGHRYQLYSSSGLADWSPLGSDFVAEDEAVTREFETGVGGRYFRVVELP